MAVVRPPPRTTPGRRVNQMPKPFLQEPYAQLERDIIETMIAGLHQWRSDLSYPESHSDMQAAVRGLLQMFDVKRRPLPLEIDSIVKRSDSNP